MMKGHPVDKFFLGLIFLFLVGGFFVFISASLGLYAREGARFGSTALNQGFIGIFLGLIALFTFSRIHYRHMRRYALSIFIAALVATSLVFVPSIGFEHGGAVRWLSVGSFSFQPAEFLKVAIIVFAAAWLSSVGERVGTFRWGTLPVLVIVGLAATPLLFQPDVDTILVIFVSVFAMYLIAGGKWKHMVLLMLAGIIIFGVLAMTKPYILERINTFINPTNDPHGAGWQLKQSLIAVGSGKVFGKGFGQSIQKFELLPEPVGDSIFAVYAEEFGFAGAIAVLAGFLLFLMRGLSIARKAPDQFSGLLAAGVVIMIVFQSFINIAAIVGVFPFTGLPLIFFSQGGSALLFSLIALGIVLNISRYGRQNA